MPKLPLECIPAGPSVRPAAHRPPAAAQPQAPAQGGAQAAGPEPPRGVLAAAAGVAVRHQRERDDSCQGGHGGWGKGSDCFGRAY